MLVKKWGVNIKKVSTLGLGLDSEIINMSNDFTNDTLNIRNFKVLSFGRITYNQKPFNLVVQPLSELTTYWDKWTIIGDGPDLDNLKNDISFFGIASKVFFTGTLDTKQIINYLNESDVIILPSNYESFFITVYESLLFKKVVITDDVADIKENLELFSNIKIVDSKNKNLYKNTIQDVFNNYNLYLKDVNKASHFIKNKYNWDQVYKKLLNLN